MSTGTPMIYESVEIADEGGANANTYTTHAQEGREIQIETQDQQVDDGQTLIDAFDGSFNFLIFDTDVLSDPNVYTDASQSPKKARLTFKGADGVNDIMFESVIINGHRDFGTNRKGVRVRGSKRAAKQDDAVNVVTS